MAGTLVERFSQRDRVVWFWFAPFKGVVGQTADSLRSQFKGLRLRELADDRSAELSRAGDVFVTTWQSVATRAKDKRNVRKDGDSNPSIDSLLASLRAQNLRVGVVVDGRCAGLRCATCIHTGLYAGGTGRRFWGAIGGPHSARSCSPADSRPDSNPT